MVNREEYLLGRPVDKAFEQMQQTEKETEISKAPKNHVEYGIIIFINVIKVKTFTIL